MARMRPSGVPLALAVAVLLCCAAPMSALLSAVYPSTETISATVPTVMRAPVQAEANAYREHYNETVRMSLASVQNTFYGTLEDLSTIGDIDMAFRLTRNLRTSANTVTVPFGGVAVAVVHSMSSPLVLTMALCARIFGGDITDWTHADLLALNPHLAGGGGAPQPIRLLYPTSRDDAVTIFEAEMFLADSARFNMTWLHASAAGASSYEAVLQAVEQDPLAVGVLPFLAPYADVARLERSYFPARTPLARAVGVARFRDISGFEVTLDASLASIQACVDVESALDTGIYDLGRESYGCYPIASTIGIVADKRHSSEGARGCDHAARLVDALRWFTGLHDGRDARAAAAAMRPSGVYPIAARSRTVELQISEVLHNITCDATSLLATFDMSCRSAHVLVSVGACDTSLEQRVSFSWAPSAVCDPALPTSVALPPPQTRTCDYIKSGSWVMALATACFCLVAGAALLLIGVLLAHRAHEACRLTLSSDLLFLSSVLLVSVNIMNVVGENDEGVCLWRAWCYNVTGCFFIAALFQKIWRTERYYNKNTSLILEQMFSRQASQRKRGDSIQQRIEDALNTHVFKMEDANGYSIAGALVCVDVLILTIWSCVSPPGVDTEYDLVAFTDRTVPVTSCGGKNKAVFLALSYGYKLVLCFYTMMITSKIYNVKSEFNELKLLSSVMPVCIATGTALFCVVVVGDYGAPTVAVATVCLWTATLLYSLLAVFHFRLWRLFPVTVDNLHYSLCCCLPLPRAAERLPAASISLPAAAAPAPEAEAPAAAAAQATTEVKSFQGAPADEEDAGAEPAAARKPSVSAAHSAMMGVAIESMTKRLMEKDAAIAARDARIAQLEEQLALVYSDLHNEGDRDG